MGEAVSALSLLPLKGPERKSLLQNIFQIKVSNNQFCQQMCFLFPEFSAGIFSEGELLVTSIKPQTPRGQHTRVVPALFL